ncbi:helix-turn-helix transcriptional regulator [Spirosoma utsteinense]|uniref:Transcriptional regulator with XRE-family HTH domain n=1 Tax=Spirosoma utsteinense TaxID=2585773 RepID=A0ABR6W1H9_9BACT|nr:helix-turn-helix transcriptional regulator [Spirosoma utsteinense]MBC3784945.1 transcriptional regulator with XRE-family HTH domain [Spirosoma utsteinense]MBC3790447.1 transcriptional regulator with XRE-family HTH domain [Spirosoma utsteinense]
MESTEIKELRLLLGISQRAFGELLGYTEPQTRVSNIETGKQTPSNQTVAACKLLKENIELRNTIKELKEILNKA